MRATWLTDLHLSMAKPQARAGFQLQLVAHKPDVLLVTGDTAEAEDFLQYLLLLHEWTNAPVYYVLGNHDFYGSDIDFVRESAQRAQGPYLNYLSAMNPTKLGDHVVLGIDGWGDANCGDPESWNVKLNDWKYIQDMRAVYNMGSPIRLETLRVLGRQEAQKLREKLAWLDSGSPIEKLLVLTHVPPFPQACVYDGKVSDADWLPWFTCIEVGKVLAEYAEAHPATQILVLCGHTHGIGTYQHMPNLEVRTGGWPKGVKDYGNPIVQATFVL